MAVRRSRSPLFILVATVLVAAVAFLLLRLGYEAVRPAEEPPPVAAVGQSIIALADGSTMVAEHGSLGREMSDWINLRQPGDAKFLLEGDAFEPGSIEPTQESHDRIRRFAELMKGNRGVTARIAVFDDDSAGSVSLAERRAERLRSELVSRGVAARRLTVQAQPAATMTAPDNKGTIVHDGQVVIVLHRRA